jgi:phytoene dehydrogenase-like protein
MTETFDVVVAGAGHNSLVAAAYLARAGLSCVVLEANDTIGGDASSQQLTVPGFVHDACSTAHNLIQSSPILRDNELDLAAHGLEYLHPDPVVHLPFPDGESLTMWRDEERTAAEFARFSRADATAYRAMMADYAAIASDVNKARYTPIGSGDSVAAALRRHGPRWLRRNAMSAWEVVSGQFEDPHSRAFMLWMSFMTMQPPERPGTGLLAYSLAFGRQRHSWTLPKGGSAALPQALASVITSHGGVIVTAARVTSLLVDRDRCTGVETEAGDTYLARRAVLSTIHVKHLVEMAPASAWGEDFLYGVQTWQPGISMFVTHYATTAAPRYSAPGGGIISPVASGTPQSVDRMLRLATDFRAGHITVNDPVLLILCPTVEDPSRAPERCHTLKVVGFQPYELAQGGPHRWDEVAGEVSAANLAELRRHAPNLTDDVLLAATIKSPLDLERMNAHNWHGSCHGGDSGPAQSGELRPVPGWASHRMPIAGLYQTGACTYPGGSVSGAPGRNAAHVLLGDLGLALNGEG